MALLAWVFFLSIWAMMIIVENYKGYSHTLPTMHIRQGDSSIIAWIALPPFYCSCLRKKAKVLRRGTEREARVRVLKSPNTEEQYGKWKIHCRYIWKSREYASRSLSWAYSLIHYPGCVLHQIWLGTKVCINCIKARYVIVIQYNSSNKYLILPI